LKGLAKPGLQKTLAGKPSLELRRWAERLLAAPQGPPLPTAGQLGGPRGRARLGWLGTRGARGGRGGGGRGAARAARARQAGGAPGAWLTEQAEVSLRRLARRQATGTP